LHYKQTTNHPPIFYHKTNTLIKMPADSVVNQICYTTYIKLALNITKLQCIMPIKYSIVYIPINMFLSIVSSRKFKVCLLQLLWSWRKIMFLFVTTCKFLQWVPIFTK